jgi:IQ calmodulin-binding motif
MDLNDAILVIQCNERGRQAREATRLKLIHKKQRQLVDRRNRSGVAITQEMAATKIQSALRGMIWRRRIKREAEEVRRATLQVATEPFSYSGRSSGPCWSHAIALYAPRCGCGCGCIDPAVHCKRSGLCLLIHFGRQRRRAVCAFCAPIHFTSGRSPMSASCGARPEALSRLALILGGNVTHATNLQELVFIGMRPAPMRPEADAQTFDRKNRTRRMLQQAENKREFEADIEALKRRVEETEGQDMRETIQDKINAWFVESRNAETGEYPEFPGTAEGGYARA